MRIFIVIGSHDVLGQFRPDMTFDNFHANSLIELLGAINAKYGKDTIIYDYEKRTESEILSQIYESNGDGDRRWIIAEVKIMSGQPEVAVILD